MDVSRGLITALIDSDKLNEVTRSGITEELLEEDSQPILSFIKRHYAEYKQVPSRTATKQVFPNYEFANYKEPVEYFIDTIKETHRRNLLEEALFTANRLYSSDTRRTEDLLRETLTRLTISQKSFKDLDLTKSTEDRLKAYDSRKANPGATGILSGWSKVDYVTLGWEPEQLIVLVGEKYIGKSWIMLWLAYQAMMQGERVLFVTKEMSAEAVARRYDSIYAQVKFDSLRRGELTEPEEKRFRSRLQQFGRVPGEGSIVMVRHGIGSIADIESKAVEVDATIVFGDSIYLFRAEMGKDSGNETSRRLAISQRCKATASNLGIPFIISTQAGRQKSGVPAADLDSIEYSNAFAQDGDCVMQITKDDIDRDLGRIKLHVLKSRDGDITKINVNCNFEYMTFYQAAEDPEPTHHIELDDEESMFTNELA